MAEPLLTIEGLSAGYGDVRVLWDISLAVAAGEITCIVGSNGAGKTTLLRTVSGLMPATSGHVVFAGENVTSRAPDQILARGIAHVPEGRRLFRGLNVRDNLLLGAYLRRDDAEIRRDLDYVFALFPILRERRRQLRDPEIRRIYEAMESGERSIFGAAVHPDYIWQIPGQCSWSKRFEGQEAIYSHLLRPLYALFATQYTARAINLVAEGDIVVAEVRGDVQTKRGARYNNEYCFIFRFRDGKIAEVTEYGDTDLEERVLGRYEDAVQALSEAR